MSPLSEEQPSDLCSLTLTKGSPQQWAGTEPTHEQKQVLPPQTQGGSLPAGHQTPGPARPESLGTLTSPIPSAPVHKQLDTCPLAVPEVIATPLDGACASGGMASPTQGSTGLEGDLPEMKKKQQQPHLAASQDGNLPSKGAGPDPAAHKGRPPREDGAAQEPKQKGEGSPVPGAPQASGSLGVSKESSCPGGHGGMAQSAMYSTPALSSVHPSFEFTSIWAGSLGLLCRKGREKHH